MDGEPVGDDRHREQDSGDEDTLADTEHTPWERFWVAVGVVVGVLFLLLTFAAILGRGCGGLLDPMSGL